MTSGCQRWEDTGKEDTTSLGASYNKGPKGRMNFVKFKKMINEHCGLSLSRALWIKIIQGHGKNTSFIPNSRKHVRMLQTGKCEKHYPFST